MHSEGKWKRRRKDSGETEVYRLRWRKQVSSLFRRQFVPTGRNPRQNRGTEAGRQRSTRRQIGGRKKNRDERVQPSLDIPKNANPDSMRCTLTRDSQLQVEGVFRPRP